MNRFLQTRYVRGGRGPLEFDCWGLTRAGRVDIFGKSLLPLCSDALPGDFRRITKACNDVSGSEGLVPVLARPGAIATAWRASLCVHVGLVVEADARLWVLETDVATGPCLRSIKSFESRFTQVIYYDD